MNYYSVGFCFLACLLLVSLMIVPDLRSSVRQSLGSLPKVSNTRNASLAQPKRKKPRRKLPPPPKTPSPTMPRKTAKQAEDDGPLFSALLPQAKDGPDFPSASTKPPILSPNLHQEANRSLLVCIAFHYKENRLQFLSKVLHRLLDTYTVPLQVVVDSNADATKQWVEKEFGTLKTLEVEVHHKLAHPFHLTWVHRHRMRRLIEDYDVFMYMEDDMDLPFPNYLRALENFKILWPSMVPVFARIETKDGLFYNTDNRSPTIVGPNHKMLIERDGRMFVHLNNAYAYCAMWFMPREALRSSLSPKFSAFPRNGLIREAGASFTTWQLGKKGVVEVQDKQISLLSWVFHLPNNKANDPKHPSGKLPIERVLCFRPRGGKQCE